MIKQLNLNRCKTFIALLLVLCNLLSIFGGIVSFNSTSIYALTQEDWYRFYKVDEEGNPVVGAQLQLLDGAGNILDEWETDGSPHDFYFFNLDANGLSYDGTLILKEVSAPEGYQIAEDIIVDPANITPILDPDEEFILGYCYMVYMIDPKAVEVPEDENLPEILKPEDSNPDTNTDLSTELEEVEEGEDIVITFTNELETIQNLTVTKQVKEEQSDGSWLDYETDETFEFNIKFSGMEEGTSFPSTIGRVTADDYGEAYKTFYLKNGESAEFFDLPIGVEYVVEESANPYKPSYMVTGVNVVKNSDEATKGNKLSTRIESIEPNEQAEVIFTNLSTTEGTLVVRKEVDGKIANPNEKFEFTITLSGNKIGGTQKFNGVTFTDGVATIELAADEEMTFELPAGTTYEVVEKEYENYDTTHDKQVVDPYGVSATEAVSNNETTGTITKNMYDVVTVTNTYNIPIQDLTISKLVKEEQLNGNMTEIEDDSTYPFHVYLENMPVNYTFADSNGETYTSDDEGKVTVDFTLTNRAKFKLLGLPVGTKYRVEETLSSNSDYLGFQPSYLLMGSTIVKNADKGENGGDLSTELETIDEGEASSVIFTNTLTMARGKLVVEKKMEGAGNPDEYFAFEIVLRGPGIMSGSQTINETTFIDGKATVHLKAGDSIDFDLPAGTEYHVVEVENEMYETSYDKQVVNPYAVDPVAKLYDYLIIDKVDEDGNHLDGAHLALIDTDGNIAMEWNTSDHQSPGYEIDVTEYSTKENMVIEDYYGWTLRELEAPDGYQLADDIIISENCFTTIQEGFNGGNDYIIHMVDKKAETIIPEIPATPETGEHGIITANHYDVITVTNTLITSNITLKKNVTNIETSAKFTINAEFKNLIPNVVYKLSNGATMTALADGTATYTAQIGHGEEIVFQDIPLNAIYKFTEVAGEYIASYKIEDKATDLISFYLAYYDENNLDDEGMPESYNEYYAEKGMTWEDWINSEYNTYGYTRTLDNGDEVKVSFELTDSLSTVLVKCNNCNNLFNVFEVSDDPHNDDFAQKICPYCSTIGSLKYPGTYVSIGERYEYTSKELPETSYWMGYNFCYAISNGPADFETEHLSVVSSAQIIPNAKYGFIS